MLRFGSFDVDTRKCLILLAFVGTDGGVQLFSRTSTTRSSRRPKRVRRGARPAPLPRRGPAAGTMSPVPGRPPRAPRSHPVKPGPQALGLGKGTTASGKPTGAPRATGPDEARRTTRGHEARQRGTPPARTKAHEQVPSSNGRRVPQARRARTTHTKPPHRNRCQATPAAVRMDECAPGGYQAPAGYEQPPSRRTSARPEGAQPLPATNSCRLDGRVSPPQRRPKHATPHAQPTAQHTERADR